jgi:hypothetical protein
MSGINNYEIGFHLRLEGLSLEKKREPRSGGQPFPGIFDMLECFDWKVRGQPYFSQLDICRLVVNVYKHGLGKALAELKKDHPQFLEDVFRNSENSVLDHFFKSNASEGY